MDKFYNQADASEKLDAVEKERKDVSSNAGTQLATSNLADYEIREFDQPPSWRICSIVEGEEPQEISFRTQGILAATDLPPINHQRSDSAMKRARQFFRQAITITGLGSIKFEDVLSRVEEQFFAFANFFTPERMEMWQPSEYATYTALDSHARYFTPKKLATGQPSVPFHPLVDPTGTLAALQNEQFVHIADNEVEYYIMNGSKIQRTTPTTFHIGDLVEVSVALVAFPAKDHKIRMVPLLRSLLLLDQTERQKASILRMKERFRPTVIRINAAPVKRRAAYDSDEISPKKRASIQQEGVTEAVANELGNMVIG